MSSLLDDAAVRGYIHESRDVVCKSGSTTMECLVLYNYSPNPLKTLLTRLLHVLLPSNYSAGSTTVQQYKFLYCTVLPLLFPLLLIPSQILLGFLLPLLVLLIVGRSTATVGRRFRTTVQVP